MDQALRPLEAKVGELLEKHGAVHGRLSELGGTIRGVEDGLEAQVRRADATETRILKWRRTLEDNIQARHAEFAAELKEAAAGPSSIDVVTQGDLRHAVEILQCDLKIMVDDACAQGGSVAALIQKEMANLEALLRQEFGNAVARRDERSVAVSDEALASHQQHLTRAAALLRHELQELIEGALASRTDMLSVSVQNRLDNLAESQKRGLLELMERTKRGEHGLESLQDELARLQEEVIGLRVADVRWKASGRTDYSRSLPFETMASRSDMLSASMQSGLEDFDQSQKRDLLELKEQAKRSQHAAESLQDELGRLQGKVSSLSATDARSETLSHREVERIVASALEGLHGKWQDEWMEHLESEAKRTARDVGTGAEEVAAVVPGDKSRCEAAVQALGDELRAEVASLRLLCEEVSKRLGLKESPGGDVGKARQTDAVATNAVAAAAAASSAAAAVRDATSAVGGLELRVDEVSTEVLALRSEVSELGARSKEALALSSKIAELSMRVASCECNLEELGGEHAGSIAGSAQAVLERALRTQQLVASCCATEHSSSGRSRTEVFSMSPNASYSIPCSGSI